jgi:WD40 repeat protein
VAYLSDGRLLIAATGTTLMAWDTSTFKEVIDPLHGHAGAIYDICVSPNNTKILSSCGDNTLRIWDLDMFITPQPTVSQVSHESPNPVISLAFSACGKKLATSTESEIYVWDTASPSSSPDFIITPCKLAQSTS